MLSYFAKIMRTGLSACMEMTNFYSEMEIDKGKPSYSGHLVYKKATLKKNKIRIIYKLNKHNNPTLSKYEVALSYLLELFLPPFLTPKQTLVKNKKNKIVGLASHHFCYSVFAREPKDSEFCILHYHKNAKERIPKTIVFGSIINLQDPENIPIYFLNEFPPGFFAQLLKAYQAKHLDIDMEALASVLCSSYTLEEDDLHKGNIGFYVVMREKKGIRIPTVVFFKIDNDLLLSNSLMSHYDARFPNCYYGKNAFAITARDLIKFPRVKDSGNHYWPDKTRYCVNATDPKIYSDFKECKAFQDLGKLREFKLAKWHEFYKHILKQNTAIEASLAQALKIEDPIERAQLDLITQAAIARLSQLKVVLFSIPEFREVVVSTDNEALLNRYQNQALPFDYAKLKEQMDFYKSCCNSNFFDAKDTPLHVAIRLGDFRYYESWRDFKKFANQSNSRGETPLDLALKLAEEKAVASKDPRSDPCFIVKFLLKQGVKQTTCYKKFCKNYPNVNLRNYRFPTIYLNEARTASTSQDLKTLFAKLSKDSRFSLKMKKNLSIACMKAFINNKNFAPNFIKIVREFQQALNDGAPELQFIRQLRSSLWIVRIIRGLFGNTSTQAAITNLLTSAKKELASIPSIANSPRFFSPKTYYSEECLTKNLPKGKDQLARDIHAA